MPLQSFRRNLIGIVLPCLKSPTPPEVRGGRISIANTTFTCTVVCTEADAGTSGEQPDWLRAVGSSSAIKVTFADALPGPTSASVSPPSGSAPASRTLTGSPSGSLVSGAKSCGKTRTVAPKLEPERQPVRWPRSAGDALSRGALFTGQVTAGTNW